MPVRARWVPWAWRRGALLREGFAAQVEEGHQPLQPVIHDDLRIAPQDVLHGLEIEPSHGNVAGLLISAEHADEALRLAAGPGFLAVAEALGFLHHPLRLAAGAGMISLR
ncbi:hypothetical protein ACFQU2_32320 [Siccirubricoccus deserti]